VNDHEDGSYTIKWTSQVPGAFHAFVKIDGLHIIGSPTLLMFTAPARTSVRSRQPVEPRVRADRRPSMFPAGLAGMGPRGSVDMVPDMLEHHRKGGVVMLPDSPDGGGHGGGDGERDGGSPMPPMKARRFSVLPAAPPGPAD
jgi:hypothetical protein